MDVVVYSVLKALIGRTLMGISDIKLDTTTNKHWIVTTTAGDTFRVAIPNSVNNPIFLNKLGWDDVENCLTYDGELIKADSVTTADVISTVECGAIKVGDRVKTATNLQGIVEQLLIKEEAPSVTVSLTVSDGKTYDTIREIGDSVSVTAKAVVTKKSYDVASTSWTTPSAISETATANGGTYTRVFSNVSNTTTFTFKAVDNKNLTGSNFKKVTFVYPMYNSLVDKDMDTTTITADDVTNGTKILKSKATFDYVVTASAEKVVWAIPQSYGQLKSIKDTKNGLELISGYEVTTLNITALDGTTVPYYVYVPVLESTIADFNYKLAW